MSEKRLYKSRDKKVCGVCGGIAEYFGIDPTMVRIIYALLVMFTGVSILPYIIAAIIMDDAPGSINDQGRIEENSYSAQDVNVSDEPVGFKADVDDGDVREFKL